jgi:hypothetical protein
VDSGIARESLRIKENHTHLRKIINNLQARFSKYSEQGGTGALAGIQLTKSSCRITLAAPDRIPWMKRS